MLNECSENWEGRPNSPFVEISDLVPSLLTVVSGGDCFLLMQQIRYTSQIIEDYFCLISNGVISFKINNTPHEVYL